MRCDEFEQRMHAVLDERGAPEFDAALAEHAADCPACRAWLQATQAVLEGTEWLAEPAAPVFLTSRVIDELHTQMVARSRRRRALLEVGSVAAVLLALGAWAWNSTRPAMVESHPLPASVAAAAPHGEPPVRAREESIGPLADALSMIPKWPTLSWQWSPGASTAGLVTGQDQQPSAEFGPSEFGAGFEPVTRTATSAFDALWQGLPAAEEPRS